MKLPEPSRIVSLGSVFRNFNDLLNVDHVYLAKNIVFHLISNVTRYSSGGVVPSTAIIEAIAVPESTWMNNSGPQQQF